MARAILWLRRDLRIADHPALCSAAEAVGGGEVIPVFVLDPVLLSSCQGPRLAALGPLLEATSSSYKDRLVVRVGDPAEVIPHMVEELDASSVHVSAETTPYGTSRDKRVSSELPDGVNLVARGSPYAVRPGNVFNKAGNPHKVFTPFLRAWREHGWPDPPPVPEGLRLAKGIGGLSSSEISQHLGGGSEDPPAQDLSEAAATARWSKVLDETAGDYAKHRDRMDLDGTSKMSPFLKFGSIHPRTLLADLQSRHGRSRDKLESELAWREFYADVLFHNPDSLWHDLTPSLKDMDYDPPQESDDAIGAWKKGLTGYPVVDAAMRQLLSEGWMHNRARMIVASFFTKDLHQWWPVGASHFLDHLVDGDMASNNHGWQWVAGTGTDAAPYFRVFNPITQGLRFDPDGDYVRRFVPELAHIHGAAVHEPWKQDDGYDQGYPQRIVDHAEERRDSLDRYQRARD